MFPLQEGRPGIVGRSQFRPNPQVFIVNAAPAKWNRHGQFPQGLVNNFNGGIGEAVKPADGSDEISREEGGIETISQSGTDGI